MISAIIILVFIVVGLVFTVRYLWNKREVDKTNTAPIINDWLEVSSFEITLLHAVAEFLSSGKDDGKDFTQLNRLVKLLTASSFGYLAAKEKIEACLTVVRAKHANRGLKINIWPTGVIDIAMGTFSYQAYGSDGKLIGGVGGVFYTPTQVRQDIDLQSGVMAIDLTFPDQTKRVGPVDVIKDALHWGPEV